MAVNSKENIIVTGAKVIFIYKDGSGRLWNKEN